MAEVSKENIVLVAAVNAVVFDGEGRILLTRRSPRIRAPGRWCLPGGHVEIGERWEEALERELAEETGLLARTLRLLGVYADPALTITEPRADGVREQFVAAVYYVDRYEGSIAPNDEVDAWGWFTADTMPEPLLSSHPPRIADAFRRPARPLLR